MHRTGAQLLVHALKSIGVRHTFGIPGVHTIEIYDELSNSRNITPILVTHECGASFMADGVSRTSDTIGTIVIVPAAGTTHAMSGIAEAYLDGIPMLIISGGTRRDTGASYQLHGIEQKDMVSAVTKGYFLVPSHRELIATIYDAYRLAISGVPGPVFVEVPVELQLLQDTIDDLPEYHDTRQQASFTDMDVQSAADVLEHASSPGLFVGWGAVHASDEIRVIAELLAAPVSTTLQGLSALPGDHPLHTGVGFGPASVPASRRAFKRCDCMLAVGSRFAELATASYGVTVPGHLIHVDIDRTVFNTNYPAQCTLEGDSKVVLQALIAELQSRRVDRSGAMAGVVASIREDKRSYLAEWTKHRRHDRVSPGVFFTRLRAKTPKDVFVVTDSGQHTFLAADLMPCLMPRHFICPADFNCMGYGVPAAIGVKFANADKLVVAIVGDAAFLMTGTELLTAKAHKLGLIVFVFHDGELGLISQWQRVPLNRKTCTVLPALNIQGIATATGSEYLMLADDHAIEGVIDEALRMASQHVPVIVDVNVDYSRGTSLTTEVMRANFRSFPARDRIRCVARAITRHVLG